KQAETEAALKQSRRQAATVAFERALSLCEQDDYGRGLLWLTRSLELAPEDATDLQRVIRLNLGSWQRELQVPLLCLEHGDAVTRVAFSPDGRTLITAGYSGVVRQWDAKTGKPIGQPLRHSDRQPLRHSDRFIDAMAVSPDGKLLVTGSRDKTAQLWDLAAGERLGSSWPHPDTVWAAAFSPDGRLAVTGCGDG